MKTNHQEDFWNHFEHASFDDPQMIEASRLALWDRISHEQQLIKNRRQMRRSIALLSVGILLIVFVSYTFLRYGAHSTIHMNVADRFGLDEHNDSAPDQQPILVTQAKINTDTSGAKNIYVRTSADTLLKRLAVPAKLDPRYPTIKNQKIKQLIEDAQPLRHASKAQFVGLYSSPPLPTLPNSSKAISPPYKRLVSRNEIIAFSRRQAMLKPPSVNAKDSLIVPVSQFISPPLFPTP